MALNVEYPSLSSGTAAEEIASIKSYLVRLADTLNVAEIGTASVLRDISAVIGNTSKPKTGESLSEYEALRSLVLKNADAVITECSSSIARQFSSRFLALSDFGSFSEEMTQTVTENAEGIERLFGYTAGINNSEGESALSTAQYVKTGLLYYESGVPVYGVGVGVISTTFEQENEVIDLAHDRLVAVTPSGIDFWESGTKVAYITDGALCLPAAVITGGSIGGCDITNGVLKISGANITSGTIAKARIPDLSATYATVEELDSAFARIEWLESDFADIGSIVADEISTATISASMINGGTLNCNRIVISNLTAGNISGGSNSTSITFSNMTHSGGTVAGWTIYTNYMTYGSARVGSGYFQVYSGSSWAAYEPSSIEYSYQGASTVSLSLRSIATSSLEEAKQNIAEYEGSALELVKGATLYGYEYRAFPGEQRYGLVIGRDCPGEIIDSGGENVNIYDMCAFAWAAIKELAAKLGV